MHAFVRQVRPALLALVALTVVTGAAYPLIVLGVGQALFPDHANGSLIEIDGTVVGSELLGQGFVAPEYFHPRPSAAGVGYDGAASSGSNLGPTNPALLDAMAQRVTDYRALNGLSGDVEVPVDAVTSSGSGLDPHISVANARLQAPRVARERDMTVDAVLEVVQDHIDERALGVLGDPGVNVLVLNLALDGDRG